MKQINEPNLRKQTLEWYYKYQYSSVNIMNLFRDEYLGFKYFIRDIHDTNFKKDEETTSVEILGKQREEKNTVKEYQQFEERNHWYLKN